MPGSCKELKHGRGDKLARRMDFREEEGGLGERAGMSPERCMDKAMPISKLGDDDHYCHDNPRCEECAHQNLIVVRL